MQVKTTKSISGNVLYILDSEDAAYDFAKLLFSNNENEYFYNACAGMFGNAVEIVQDNRKD